MRVTQISFESLVRGAREKTGLNDLGDEIFLNALSCFIDSVNRESQLTEMGRDTLFAETTQYLTNRLYLEQHFAAYPEIADEVIQRPAVITGLYRSGTTKLHRLLCYDSRWQSLKTWQTMYPAPLGLDDPSPAGRVALANEILQRMADFAPGSLEAHPMDADQPEEEYLLMVQSLQTARVVLNTPSHARWCEQQNAEPMYRYFKRCLQLLQWEKKRQGQQPSRLIMKAPVHLETLPALCEVFPDVQVIITHRDPAISVASNCRMLEHMLKLYSDTVDLHRLGEEKLHTAALALGRSVAARGQLDSSCIMELPFENIAKRSMDFIPALYEFLDEPLDGAVIDAIVRGEAELQSHRSSEAHQYELSRYGLDREAVYAGTSKYLNWVEENLGLQLADHN